LTKSILVIISVNLPDVYINTRSFHWMFIFALSVGTP